MLQKANKEQISELPAAEFITKIKSYSNKAAFKLLLELNEKELSQIHATEKENSQIKPLPSLTTKDSEEKRAFPQNSGESIDFNFKKISSQETAETLRSSKINSSQSSNSALGIKNRKLLSVLNSSKDCQLCLKKSPRQLIKEVLNKKYMTSRDSYNVKVVNDVIYNESTHIVSIFKDYLIFDDVSEFLRRYYKVAESKQRLPKVFDFYEKYSKVFPNYVVLPESKNMFKNIEKKQKLIDEQQRNAADQKSKKDHLNDSDDDNEIFNTLFLNELNKPGSTYDMNASQQATESQLFSYIKNSKIKGSDVTIEKSFQNLLEKVLMKESMSFADPKAAKVDPIKKKAQEPRIVKSIPNAVQKNPAFCKIQINDKARSSCLVSSKQPENITTHASQFTKSINEHASTCKSISKPKVSTEKLVKKTKPATQMSTQVTSHNNENYFSDSHNQIKTVSCKPSKVISPGKVVDTLTQAPMVYKDIINILRSPKIEMEIKETAISRESKPDQSRNLKWQPKENDHYLTNNIFSDPSTRTHSSLKTPKPTHKFTDIDIQKIVSNINMNNEKQKNTPISVYHKKANNTPSHSNTKFQKDTTEKLNTERISLQSRNSKTQNQLSVHNKGTNIESKDQYKKTVIKDYKGLMLDIESINKHAKQLANEMATSQNLRKPALRQSTSTKTPDPMRPTKVDNSKSKIPKSLQQYQLPQTAKSVNEANRLLFSKSVSNCDKYKYRIDQKQPLMHDCKKEIVRTSVRPSSYINAQTPGSIHSQAIFKHNK